MPSTNPRTSRSRFSSPAHLSNSPSSHNRGVAASEGQRSFMQRWLEPPVQNKASYQDAGLVKGGVVENMAPLGTMPKAAMLKKPTLFATTSGDQASDELSPAPSGNTVKRIVLKKPYHSATPNATNSPSPIESSPTPAASIAPVLDMGDSAEASEVASLGVYPGINVDDAADDDWVPQQKGRSRRASAQKSRKSTPAGSASSRRQSTRKRGFGASATPTPDADRELGPSSPDSGTLDRAQQAKALVEKVVLAAVEEALSHYRYPTAWALRQLYDENAEDGNFVTMIEDIYHQRADAATLLEFNRLVEEKKREGKQDNKGCRHFNGNALSPQKPVPAPYSDLITFNKTRDQQATPCERASKKMKLDSGGRAAHKMAGDEGTPTKKGSGLKRSPTKGRKKRSGSVSSSSSLSSAPDDMPEDYEEYMDRVNDDLGLGVSRPPSSSAAEPNNAPTPANPAQPISAAQKRKPASKKKDASPNASSQNNNAAQDPSPSMPGVVLTTGASRNSNSNSAAATSHKKLSGSKSAALDPTTHELLELKRGKKAETNNLTKLASAESFSRVPLGADEKPPSTPRASVPRGEPARTSLKTPALTGRATRAAKRNHEELDDSISPSSLSLRPDFPEPPSTRGSRAGTPSHLRSAAGKKARSGIRVKTS